MVPARGRGAVTEQEAGGSVRWPWLGVVGSVGSGVPRAPLRSHVILDQCSGFFIFKYLKIFIAKLMTFLQIFIFKNI